MANMTQGLNQAAIRNAKQRPDIQTAFYGLNTSSSPYLLTQHSPYLLNMKFHDSGQSLNRRDGHKIYKDFTGGEKIIAATKALNGDVYYITREISSGKVHLHSLIKHKFGHSEYMIEITSLAPVASDDKIKNFDVIVGFISAALDVFPYFNIIKANGTKTRVFLQTDKTLSTIDTNKTITASGLSSTPIPIVTHSYFNNKLFVIIEKSFDQYELQWGTDANPLKLTLSIDIPNDDEVYAMKSFSDSLFIFCENTVYRVEFDDKESKAKIQVNSESYGITSNKLLMTVGSTIYYYGESSGLASMMGSTADSILDAATQQKPSDFYMANFHKVFKADQMCYKKDDKSIYIIGSVKCNYISEAIHWQEVYLKADGMNDDQYIASLDKFKAEIAGKNRFIIEYNVAMQRFSLHYYDKDILGHFNFRMKIPGLDKDQSSELIFTEDYLATTSNDFTTDNGKEFPVQITSIPRSKGLFEGFITSAFVTHIKFCANAIPNDGGYVAHVPCDIPMSIISDGYTMYSNYSDANFIKARISQTVESRLSHSDINPCVLVGFSSKDILVFEGFQVNSEMTAVKTS